jgi:peptide/nickel transport system substrate-binding protein
VLNYNSPLFKDVRVRQALNHATPVDDILKNVYFGQAQPMRSSAPPIFPNATTEFWKYQLDLSKAKQLLADAGHQNGFDLKVLYSSEFTEMEQIAIILQSAYKQIGVNLTLDKQPAAAYNEHVNKNDFVAAVYNDFPILPDVAYGAFLFWRSTSPLNVSRYANPEVDRLIQLGLTTIDPAARKDANLKLQQAIINDIPDVFIAYPNYQVALRSYVSNVLWLPENTVRFAELDTNKK